jgi:hypothetical protein
MRTMLHRLWTRRRADRPARKPFRPVVERLEELIAPAPVVRTGSGANAAAIQAAVDQFRTDLGGGTTAGPNGSFGGVRREINWDGTPDGFSAPNSLPFNFFSLNSPRGANFATPAPGSGFQVSADDNNPSSTPVEFGNLDPSYTGIFQTFSPQRLFTPIGNNITDVTFVVATNTGVTATTSGFGVVFTDVDAAANATVQLFDAGGVSLGVFQAPAANNGLSFVGVSFDAGERVARARITSGNVAAGPGVTDGGPNDVIVMDDFIYGEPQAQGGTIQFSAPVFSATENGGTATLTVTRTGGTGMVTANVATSNRTAIAGFDYLATVGTVTFAPGDNSETITIPLLDNALTDGIRSFTASLGNVTGSATVGTQSQAVVNIIDNESPAVNFVGVTATNQLVRFSSADLAAITTTAINGLQGGETLRGIDFRPATGELYGLGSTGRLYVINLASGQATQVGMGTFDPALNGNSFGFDFNPVPDRIRIVSDTEQNLRVNPNNGAVVDGDPNTGGVQPDGNLDFAPGDANDVINPNIVGAAYTNSVPNAASTTLYVLDSTLDILALQGSPGGAPTSPNGGRLFTVGPLGFSASDVVGFDIGPGNAGFAALTAQGGTGSQLFTVNLTTGAATLLGSVGANTQLVGLTVVPNVSFQFSATTFAVNEDAGNATITVTRNSTQGQATLGIQVTGGTATQGANPLPSIYFPPTGISGDFGAPPGTINFADGQNTVTFNVPIRDDGRSEGNETVILSLLGVGVLSTATLTINDNDGALTNNQQFVTQTFFELLGRQVDAGSLQAFSAQLDAGAPRSQVVQTITSSTEYRARVVQDVFQKLLLRPADQAGQDTFVGILAAGGTIQQVVAGVAGSAEYFQTRGGGTQNGFINALFQDVLGRAAGPGDIAAFQGQSQAQVANAVVGSTEYTGALVSNFYTRFLFRAPDGGGFFFFASQLAGGRRVEQVIGDILSSDEFFNGL